MSTITLKCGLLLGAWNLIRLPNIIETENITIVGCAETYINVPFQQTFNCTTGSTASISATLFFNDGSNLTLTMPPGG